MQATSNAGTLERLLSGILLASGHETGHFMLGELNLATTKGRQRDISDLEFTGGSRHCGCVVCFGV